MSQKLEYQDLIGFGVNTVIASQFPKRLEIYCLIDGGGKIFSSYKVSMVDDNRNHKVIYQGYFPTLNEAVDTYNEL